MVLYHTHRKEKGRRYMVNGMRRENDRTCGTSDPLRCGFVVGPSWAWKQGQYWGCIMYQGRTLRGCDRHDAEEAETAAVNQHILRLPIDWSLYATENIVFALGRARNAYGAGAITITRLSGEELNR